MYIGHRIAWLPVVFCFSSVVVWGKIWSRARVATNVGEGRFLFLKGKYTFLIISFVMHWTVDWLQWKFQPQYFYLNCDIAKKVNYVTKLYLLKISYVALIIKVPHTRVILTYTVQECDGPRKFMDITVTALKVLTAFDKFYALRTGTIALGTTVQVVSLGYKLATDNWIQIISYSHTLRYSSKNLSSVPVNCFRSHFSFSVKS